MRKIQIVSLVALLGIPLAGQQAPTPPAPTFKSDVNAVLVDVRVLDRDGRFVSDLTKDDLEIFEDGQPQTITTFDLVNIPIHPDERPTFAGKTVDADVASNERADGRLYVVVLDDYHTHPLRSATVQALAHEFIEHNLTEVDRAVVLTTSGRRDVAQEFTNNRKRLLDLVDRFQGGYATGARCADTGNTGQCGVEEARAALQSLSALAKWLSTVNGRRKAIVFISEGFDGDLSNTFDAADSDVDADIDAVTGGTATKGSRSADTSGVSGDLDEVINEAARSNVSIYSIDPHGLPGGTAAGIKPAPMLGDDDPTSAKEVQSRQMLEILSNETGGYALTRSNDFTGAFTKIVAENSSYYLLGYVPTNGKRDGKFRRLQVRTTRPGLKIQSRTGYTAKNDVPARRPAKAAPLPADLTELMATPVQVSGLTMTISAPSFLGKASKDSVEVIADVTGRDLQFLSEAARSNGSLELLIAVADTDGHIRASEHGSLDMKLSAATRDAVSAQGVRLLSRLEVAPGRYLLRIAGVDGVGHTRGSVQYDLDVPDFGKGPLTMSGLALASSSERGRPTTGSDKVWKQRFTEPPTAERVFTGGDELRVSGEIYSNEKQPVRIEMTSTVQDEAGNVVFRHEETLPGGASGKPASFPHQTTIPLKDVHAGAYLLTVEARNKSNPKAVASRQLPFTVR